MKYTPNNLTVCHVNVFTVQLKVNNQEFPTIQLKFQRFRGKIDRIFCKYGCLSHGSLEAKKKNNLG